MSAPAAAAERSVHVICELVRLANCGYCWARPQHPCAVRELVDNYIALSRYTTLEDLAEAVHDGLVDADDDARSVLEQVRRIAGRKRLSVVPDPPDGGE